MSPHGVTHNISLYLMYFPVGPVIVIGNREQQTTYSVLQFTFSKRNICGLHIVYTFHAPHIRCL